MLRRFPIIDIFGRYRKPASSVDREIAEPRTFRTDARPSALQRRNETLSPEMRAMLAAANARIAALPEIDPDDLGRHLDIEKAWHAVHFIVAGTAWETDESEPATLFVLGGDECGEDAGYGPARLHSPAAVAAIAAALPETALLRRGFVPPAFEHAEIYPQGWETAPIDETWDWIASAYDQVRAFYREAAEAGHAVVVWIN